MKEPENERALNDEEVEEVAGGMPIIRPVQNYDPPAEPDVYDDPADYQSYERFDPATGTWVPDPDMEM